MNHAVFTQIQVNTISTFMNDLGVRLNEHIDKHFTSLTLKDAHVPEEQRATVIKKWIQLFGHDDQNPDFMVMFTFTKPFKGLDIIRIVAEDLAGNDYTFYVMDGRKLWDDLNKIIVLFSTEHYNREVGLRSIIIKNALSFGYSLSSNKFAYFYQDDLMNMFNQFLVTHFDKLEWQYKPVYEETLLYSLVNPIASLPINCFLLKQNKGLKYLLPEIIELTDLLSELDSETITSLYFSDIIPDDNPNENELKARQVFSRLREKFTDYLSNTTVLDLINEEYYDNVDESDLTVHAYSDKKPFSIMTPKHMNIFTLMSLSNDVVIEFKFHNSKEVYKPKHPLFDYVQTLKKAYFNEIKDSNE